MVDVRIDGRPLAVPEGTMILRAAELAGVAIPHFCHHPAFPPEGSCRMCLVEIDGCSKLELACATPVRRGLAVRTDTERVRRARREVLELMLAEHPLDCPVCDKAGECRLQDYHEAWGSLVPAFLEERERREKKVPIGGRLILDRERCVLCTRCVRFLAEVTKTGELGVFERGIRSEIGVFDGRPVDTAYAGNLVDLCPVGAITDAGFRFRPRAWFLESAPAVCPRCARGCAVTIDSVAGYPLAPGERRVYRVRPRENPGVNGFWICDAGRYGYQADLEAPRLASPVLRKAGRMAGVSVSEALSWVGAKLRGTDSAGADRTIVLLNSGLTNEELRLARALFVDRMKIRRVLFADPPGGEADGFLITADRTPNRRGAEAAGFALRPADPESLAGETDLLLAFGSPAGEEAANGPWTGLFSTIPAKALFASSASAWSDVFDAVLPTCRPAEKAGSFTNADGLVQFFEPALTAPGGVLSEAEILARLAGEAG